MRQILIVPLDGSDLSESVLPWALSLARSRNLTVVLARVVDYPVLAGTGGMGDYTPSWIYEDLLDSKRAEAQEYLGTIQQRGTAAGIEVETTIMEGDPVEGVLELAEARGAYAIAMATHGHSRVSRLLLGSVAERVLHHSTVSVFLVRAQDSSMP